MKELNEDISWAISYLINEKYEKKGLFRVVSVNGKLVKDKDGISSSQKEQDEIVSYIDRVCSGVNEIIADKKAQLETLEEYKKSLIYEYVTGKKEV